MRVSDKTWFYFGMGDGADRVDDVGLTLGLANGGIIQRRVTPNQPLRLLTGEADVRNVRLHITPTSVPYRLKFREIGLFEPHTVSYAQAFAIPLPAYYSVTPQPVLHINDAQVLVAQPGHVAGVVTGETLRFSTQLDPDLDWVRGMRLKYRLPLKAADDAKCQLTLQFNWAHGMTERQVCFMKSDDTLFISMASFLGKTGQPRDLGTLKSIDWALHTATGVDKGVPESFDLQFSVEGWAIISAADLFHFSPLLYAGGHSVFADIDRAKDVASWHDGRKMWLPLESRALQRMLAADGEIQPAEHKLFTLDKVVVEPRQPISWYRWRQLIDPPPSYAPPRWPKLLLWASMLLLVGVSWKRGWWSPQRVWNFGKASIDVAYMALHWLALLIGMQLWRWLPRFNMAIGVLALGPGLWLAGQFGLTFSGTMLLATSVLVAWGAYCHWREKDGAAGEAGATMPVRLGALALALGCAIWSLGRYKLSAEALWGFLPLFGAIYALLPALYRLGPQLVLRYSRSVSLGGWLMLTVALYGLGVLVRVGRGENYFFAFGGLAAVFALRAGLLVLESRFRRLFPSAAERVYGGAGSLYFFGALVMLVATAAVLSVKIEPIAEQLAIVAYYCLVIGTAKEVWALRTARRAKAVEGENTQVPSKR